MDLDAERARLEEGATEADLASRLMYPQVYETFAAHREEFGDTSVLPTEVFFYGMSAGQEVSVNLELGKTLVIRFQAVGELHEDGSRLVFFELNGPATHRARQGGWQG